MSVPETPKYSGSFIGYVGDPDFHDGSVLSVDRDADVVRVRVRGYSGRTYVAEFCGVHAVSSNRPEGMTLYALSEMRAPAPTRRFAFANWDDDDDAMLEIDAETVRVYEEPVV